MGNGVKQLGRTAKGANALCMVHQPQTTATSRHVGIPGSLLARRWRSSIPRGRVAIQHKHIVNRALPSAKTVLQSQGALRLRFDQSPCNPLCELSHMAATVYLYSLLFARVIARKQSTIGNWLVGQARRFVANFIHCRVAVSRVFADIQEHQSCFYLQTIRPHVRLLHQQLFECHLYFVLRGQCLERCQQKQYFSICRLWNASHAMPTLVRKHVFVQPPCSLSGQ